MTSACWRVGVASWLGNLRMTVTAPFGGAIGRKTVNKTAIVVACGLLLASFATLYWRGMRTAHRAPDRFGFYLALGLTHLLVLQALVNMLVCLGLLPTKGLPLPFISYGGSSLLASMAAVGVLLNISQHSN